MSSKVARSIRGFNPEGPLLPPGTLKPCSSIVVEGAQGHFARLALSRPPRSTRRVRIRRVLRVNGGMMQATVYNRKHVNSQ